MALMAARRTIAAVKTFLIYINAEQKGMLPATSSSNHLSPCLPFLIVCGIIYLYQRESVVVMIIPQFRINYEYICRVGQSFTIITSDYCFNKLIQQE